METDAREALWECLLRDALPLQLLAQGPQTENAAEVAPDHVMRVERFPIGLTEDKVVVAVVRAEQAPVLLLRLAQLAQFLNQHLREGNPTPGLRALRLTKQLPGTTPV